MPRIIETTVYYLDELSKTARDKARAWYREHYDEHWFDGVFQDFERVSVILGLRLRTYTARLHSGDVVQKPCIWFSGFWRQSDGASFDTFYAYQKDAQHRIREYAAQDTKLHQIADALHAIQRRNFYQLTAQARRRGRYSHEYCMAISVERAGADGQEMTADAEKVVIEALRDLARWLYRQLESEYTHLTSDEVVDDAILANQYTFTETGKRFG